MPTQRSRRGSLKSYGTEPGEKVDSTMGGVEPTVEEQYTEEETYVEGESGGDTEYVGE